MKLTLTIIFLSICSFQTFSQNEGLSGSWYSAEQDYIEFKPKYWTIENGKNLNHTGFTVFQKNGNRLRFLEQYYRYDRKYNSHLKTNFKKRFDFILKECTAEYIVLEPASKYSKEFFRNRPQIQFFRRQHFIDTSITFEKMVFRTTECFGNCPTLDIQLDNQQNIIYSGSVYRDTALTGNFTGKISKQVQDTLLLLLANCQLQTLHWQSHACCDAPMITLIIYYNGKRKYFKSMFPPQIAEDLISFLYEINSKAALTRCTDKFEFEK